MKYIKINLDLIISIRGGIYKLLLTKPFKQNQLDDIHGEGEAKRYYFGITCSKIIEETLHRNWARGRRI